MHESQYSSDITYFCFVSTFPFRLTFTKHTLKKLLVDLNSCVFFIISTPLRARKSLCNPHRIELREDFKLSISLLCSEIIFSKQNAVFRLNYVPNLLPKCKSPQRNYNGLFLLFLPSKSSSS